MSFAAVFKTLPLRWLYVCSLPSQLVILFLVFFFKFMVVGPLDGRELIRLSVELVEFIS